MTPAELDLKIALWFSSDSPNTISSLADAIGVSIKDLYRFRNQPNFRPLIEKALDTLIDEKDVNKPWFAKLNRGVDPTYWTEEDLWQSCCEYFDWVENNPLYEEKVFHDRGELVYAQVSKMRCMTIEGLCLYLGIHKDTWYEWAKKEHLAPATRRVSTVIRDSKFVGAAGGMLNPLVITRDLGLTDSIRNQQVGDGGGPVRQDVTVTFVRPGDVDKSTGQP